MMKRIARASLLLTSLALQHMLPLSTASSIDFTVDTTKQLDSASLIDADTSPSSSTTATAIATPVTPRMGQKGHSSTQRKLKSTKNSKKEPGRSKSRSKDTKSSKSKSSKSKSLPTPQPTPPAIRCFDSATEAGAIGSLFLASFWYEILATQCDRNKMRLVFNKFFTTDVILQASNATVIATNRNGIYHYWSDSLHAHCSAGASMSWMTHEITIEPSVYDDLVWGGNMVMVPAITNQNNDGMGYFFMIQLGGQRGGYSLRGYDNNKRSTPRQAECYKPIIYAMVARDSFGTV